MSVHVLIISYLASKVDANLSAKHCQIKHFYLIYVIIRLYENTNATIVDIWICCVNVRLGRTFRKINND